MFHQVFICNPDDEEEAHTEQDFKAHTEQDFKAHTEQDFKEEDDVGAEPAELEVKQETQELKLETSDLKVETKPWVDSVYSDLVQVMKREPVCSDLVQEMKLEPKPEPGLEEPYEILPDIEPEEDKEGLRREFSDEEQTGKIGLKTIIYNEELNSFKSTDSSTNIGNEQVLPSEKSEKHNQQYTEEQTELGDFGHAEKIKNCFLLLKDCMGQDMRLNIPNSGGSGKSDSILQAPLTSQSGEVSSRSERDDEVSVFSEMETDSGSDWEQEFIQSTGEFPISRTSITSKTFEKTPLKGQKCMKNVKEKTNSHCEINVIGGLRREFLYEENTENTGSKAMLDEEVRNKSLTKSIDNMQCENVLHSGKHENQDRQNVVEQNELQSQNITNSDMLLCRIGENVKSDASNFHDSKPHVMEKVNKNETLSSSQKDDESFRSERDDEVSASSEMETDPGSDWEQEFVRPTGKFSTSRTLNTRKSSKQKNLITDFNAINNSNIKNIDEIFKEELFFCTICKKIFKTKIQLDNHTKYSLCGGNRRRSAVGAECDTCGKVFQAWGQLRVHEASHTNEKPHKCTECDKCFKSNQGRVNHINKVHKNIQTLFLCSSCGITSKSISHMLAHEETHRLPEGSTIEKPFRCHHCGKGFISRFQVTRHQKEHRKQKCSKCNEEFDSKLLFRKHKESVHGIIKIYTCNICDKTFNTDSGIKNHKISHSNILKFFCEICDKGFKQKHHVEQHMITHSDERPFSCPECDETFKRKTHLKQHMASAHGKGNKPRKSQTTT